MTWQLWRQDDNGVRYLIGSYLQRHGIGGMLVKARLAELHELGGRGCILLGEPEYYGRFGFKALDGVTLAGVPPEYFLALPFTEDEVRGAVSCHEAIAVCDEKST